MIRSSVDGITWGDPPDVQGNTASLIMLLDISALCGCPPYGSVVAGKVFSKGVRPDSRYGSVLAEGVNPATGFTDDMWCRDREPIVASEPTAKAHRE